MPFVSPITHRVVVRNWHTESSDPAGISRCALQAPSCHHTFEQFFVEPDQPVPPSTLRTAAYEQGNTYSNLNSQRHRWLNLLLLNFCYHNAHHQRASVPWYRLPAFRREGAGRADAFIGAHGVSFLTVI